MEHVFCEDASRQMLAALRTRLLVMFAHVGIALDESGKALVRDDAARALAVQEGDAVIDDLENEIDERCLRIMARLQPVAGDLRFVVAALRMVVELERIGDEAAAIAERVLLLHELPIREEDMRRLRGMFAQSRAAFAQASDAFREEDAEAARHLRAGEDEALQAEVALVQALMPMPGEDGKAPEDPRAAIHAMLIVRSLTRIWRRSANIAEQVYFMRRGDSLKHGRLV